MKLITQTSIILLFLSLFISCKKEDIQLKNSFPNTKVLFQKEYINHAWGYSHNGWIIDSAGNVYSYNLPEQWNNNDSLGNISKSLMEENLSFTKQLTFKIDQSTLLEKTQLIEDVSAGSLTQPNNVMFDAGISAYYCFTFNVEEKNFKRTIVKQIGDFNIDNQSKAANELYLWMQEIDDKIRAAN